VVAKACDRVRLFSKRGTEWTDRLPRLAEAFTELPANSAVLDGELCVCDDRGRPDFRALHTEMRQGRPDVSRMTFFAFDLLFERNVNLRRLSFSERQRDLRRLCSTGHVACLHVVQ
jgi:bifunctional non-homologous end joining protein LigD